MTIRKKGSQWCVITSRSEECFSSKKKAQKRLGQIEFFKKMSETRLVEYKKDDDKRMLEKFAEALDGINTEFRKKVIPDNRGGLPLLQRFAENRGAKPAAFMIANAKAGLKIREQQSPSNRGGTAVGVARARDIANNKTLSLETLKRIKAFASRHRGTKPKGKSGKELRESKWGQAMLLWGANPANPEQVMKWADGKINSLEKK